MKASGALSLMLGLLLHSPAAAGQPKTTTVLAPASRMPVSFIGSMLLLLLLLLLLHIYSSLLA